MSSYQYRKLHCSRKMVVKSSYLRNDIFSIFDRVVMLLRNTYFFINTYCPVNRSYSINCVMTCASMKMVHWWCGVSTFTTLDNDATIFRYKFCSPAFRKAQPFQTNQCFIGISGNDLGSTRWKMQSCVECGSMLLQEEFFKSDVCVYIHGRMFYHTL